MNIVWNGDAQLWSPLVGQAVPLAKADAMPAFVWVGAVVVYTQPAAELAGVEPYVSATPPLTVEAVPFVAMVTAAVVDPLLTA